MRLLAALVLVISCGSCAPRWVTPPLVKSPDGTAWWYDIQCPGGAGGLTDCMYVAAHFCKDGYDIMDGSQGRPRVRPAPITGGYTPTTGSGTPIPGGYAPATGGDDELLVQCKKPAPESP